MTRDPSRKRKLNKIIPIALAGVAVVGVGAALTSAAWTDNVAFGATTASQTFDLQSSVDAGTTWNDVAGDDATVTFTNAQLAKLSPGDTVTLPFTLKNAGTATAQISAVVSTPTGSIFAGTKPAVVAINGFTANTTTIAPSAEASGNVVITV